MIYENEKTKAISFPIGGIGTGCIGLAGDGQLIDWEIFNRPNKNSRNGYSHFAIKATRNGKSSVRVLHGDTNESLMGNPGLPGHAGFGYGPHTNSLAGFPHFRHVSFNGSFPLANLTFSDEDFPAVIRLCAFNPFIPHNEFDSSLPAGFFEWEIENITEDAVEFAIAGTVRNPAAHSFNQKISTENANGILFESREITDTEIGYSDLCLLTDSRDVEIQEFWYRGKWQDGCTVYWKNLLELDRMPERRYDTAGEKDHGTAVSYLRLLPKQKASVRFVIAWNVPVAYNYWTKTKPEQPELPTWRNYYATCFENSLATARYALAHFDSLYEQTKRFSDAIQAATLPESVKDAISANLSVIKTPTALRLEDGTFWAWEGCSTEIGSCFGTCQHVWNYAYVMPYLFPRLERSIRELTIQYGLQEDGATSFRIDLPPIRKMSSGRACVDGQMGEVIKCYREWKFSGDTDWLQKNAESIFQMLEYAWSKENPDGWDADMDGVLEGRQHHTLDMELFGPSSWLQGFYLLALDCGAKIAIAVGDEKRTALYSKLYQSGKAWMNEHLFNGSYFFQKIDLFDKGLVDRFDAANTYWNDEAGEIKYQIANGCIIDQMLADWHAALIGLDGVFDPEKKRTALRSLYQNNFKDSMRKITNMWRNFSLNDEAGTVITSYPDGVQTPVIPIPYCEETMTGFEYALAGLLISEGYFAEGERLVSAIRDRYDGEKRNPWNELECGSNYARSMASFALLPIYSGFTYDTPKKHIGFAPKSEIGRFPFSVAESFGMAEFERQSCRLIILGNPLELNSITLPDAESITSVIADGAEIEFQPSSETLLLENTKIYHEISFIRKEN